ncbi:DUF4453 domain-containing protein [Rhodobacteraceae bacterium NNCM2]|nr:DUF4453 domain-containing protein [Coraliihabitans acroporae]
MRYLKPALLSLCLLSTPASAEVWEYGPEDCNVLWFMRNLIMDRAGYCFGSNLGKAIYDNGDCKGTEVSLTAAQQQQVGKIRKLEKEIGCKVNTGQTQLKGYKIDAIRRLRDMPLPDNGGSACTWAGAPLDIYDGYSKGSSVMGQLSPGDRIGFGWIGEGDWNVIGISAGGPGGPESLGWLDMGKANFEASCTNWAG